jgi:uncharacterized protein
MPMRSSTSSPGMSRGFYFKSEPGNLYYYDDFSGLVYPIDAKFKEALDAVTESPSNTGPSQNDTQAYTCRSSFWGEFIQQRHDAYGAFFGYSEPTSNHRRVNPEEIENYFLKNGFHQLILVITDHCNLQCRYCVNSEVYPYKDAHAHPKSMTLDVAESALNYYFLNVQRIRQTANPSMPAAVTFYGGEPLLRMDIIKYAVNWLKKHKIHNVYLSLSTNGLLLKDNVVDFLVENRFAVFVSLDGPKAIHDRNRVFQNGAGSFEKVMSNIERFWKRYPEYTLLGFLVTFDWSCNLKELDKFFSSKPNFQQSLFNFNSVKEQFTAYYDRFNCTDKKLFFNNLKKLRECMETQGTMGTPVMRYLVSMPFRLWLLRRILSPNYGGFFQGTQTCIPGDKLSVMPDGSLQPCERVPGLGGIGSVDEGLNYEGIAELINRYNQAITNKCTDCPVSRLCTGCFAHFWNGSNFQKPVDNFCDIQVKGFRQLLSEQFTLLEKKPQLYNEMMGAFADRCSYQSSL